MGPILHLAIPYKVNHLLATSLPGTCQVCEFLITLAIMYQYRELEISTQENKFLSVDFTKNMLLLMSNYFFTYVP